MSNKLLSLAMIVRNNESDLRQCLQSCASLFDQIVIVDTGSTDKTIDVAKQFGAEVYQYQNSEDTKDWPHIDDFSAARAISFQKCTSKYTMWLDSDDKVFPAQLVKLQQLKSELLTSTAFAYIMVYNYHRDHRGIVTKPLNRRRIVMNHPDIKWEYPIHEIIMFPPELSVNHIDRTDIEIDHTRQHTKSSDSLTRNIRILERAYQIDKYKNDGRIQHYLAREYIDADRYQEAIDLYTKHLKNMPDYVKMNAMFYNSVCHFRLGNHEKAKYLCNKAIQRDPRFAEFYCLLGRMDYDKGSYELAGRWYKKALKCEVPKDTWETMHMEFYKDEPENMLRALDFQKTRPAVTDTAWLLPVHEADSSKRLMPLFLDSWKKNDSDKYGMLYVMNNGCDSWLKECVDKYELKNVEIVDLGSNLGFIGAINKGILHTKSKYVGFLNTDVLFKTPDWMPNLIVSLMQNEKCGGTGFNCRGYQLKNQLKIGWLEFSCALFQRSALDDIGPYLDTTFGHGYFEDDDLCLRLLLKGWELIAINPMIDHKPRQSTPDYVKQISNNYVKFLDLWEPVAMSDPFITEYLQRQREFFTQYCPWILTSQSSDQIIERVKKSPKPYVLGIVPSGPTIRVREWFRTLDQKLGGTAIPILIMYEPYFKVPDTYIVFQQPGRYPGDQIIKSLLEKFVGILGLDKWYIFSWPESTVFQTKLPELPVDTDGLLCDTEILFDTSNLTTNEFDSIADQPVYNHMCFAMKGSLLKDWVSSIDLMKEPIGQFNLWAYKNKDRWKVLPNFLLSLHGSMTLGNNVDIKDRQFVNLSDEDKPYAVVCANQGTHRFFEDIRLRFGAIVVVLNEESTIGYCLESIYPYVDRIIITTSEYTWAGEKVKLDRTPQIIAEFPDPLKKITIIKGKWDRDDFARNDALKLLEGEGIDYAAIVDGDEVWDEQAIVKLKDVAAYYNVDAYRASWWTYWKDLYHRIDPPESFHPIVMVKVKNVRFTWIRECENIHTKDKCGYNTPNCIDIPPNELMLHHFSYSHSDEIIYNKIKKSPHAKEFIPQWYENVWMKWTVDMTDIHPTNPAQYKRASISKWEDLPAVIKKKVLRPVEAMGITATITKPCAITLCGYTPIVDRWVESMTKLLDIYQPVIIMYEPYFEVPKDFIVIKRAGQYNGNNVERFRVVSDVIRNLGISHWYLWTDAFDSVIQKPIVFPTDDKINVVLCSAGLLHSESQFWAPICSSNSRYSVLMNKPVYDSGIFAIRGSAFVQFIDHLLSKPVEFPFAEQLVFNEWLIDRQDAVVEDKLLALYSTQTGKRFPTELCLSTTDISQYYIVHANNSTSQILNTPYIKSKKRPIKQGSLNIAVVVAYEQSAKWHSTWPIINALKVDHEVTIYNPYNQANQYDFSLIDPLFETRNSYDLVLLFDIGNIRTDKINALQYPGIIIGEMGDDPQKFQSNVSCALRYDILHTPDLSCVQRYKTLGWENVYWLTHCYDQSAHKPYENVEIKYDVVTSMHEYGPRANTLKTLEGSKDFSFKNLTNLWGSDYALGLCSGKIVFNQSNHQEITRRVFEALACKQLLITDKIPEQTGFYQLFEPGKDLVLFESEADLFGKIKYYLEHEDERKAIAESGYQKVQIHSGEARAKNLIDIYRNYK